MLVEEEEEVDPDELVGFEVGREASLAGDRGDVVDGDEVALAREGARLGGAAGGERAVAAPDVLAERATESTRNLGASTERLVLILVARVAIPVAVVVQRHHLERGIRGGGMRGGGGALSLPVGGGREAFPRCGRGRGRILGRLGRDRGETSLDVARLALTNLRHGRRGSVRLILVAVAVQHVIALQPHGRHRRRPRGPTRDLSDVPTRDHAFFAFSRRRLIDCSQSIGRGRSPSTFCDDDAESSRQPVGNVVTENRNNGGECRAEKLCLCHSMVISWTRSRHVHRQCAAGILVCCRYPTCHVLKSVPDLRARSAGALSPRAEG